MCTIKLIDYEENVSTCCWHGIWESGTTDEESMQDVFDVPGIVLDDSIAVEEVLIENGNEVINLSRFDCRNQQQ